MFIRHSTLNGSWYPDVNEIDPHVEYLIPTRAFRRHDRGQNLGFRQGVDQGGNGCLWLVYAAQVLREKGQRDDIYHVQRTAQDLKSLCAPMATQLTSALGKPVDFAAAGVPGDMETWLTCGAGYVVENAFNTHASTCGDKKKSVPTVLLPSNRSAI
jgi:hypothetical protein